jgi:hypothetical protein
MSARGSQKDFVRSAELFKPTLALFYKKALFSPLLKIADSIAKSIHLFPTQKRQMKWNRFQGWVFTRQLTNFECKLSKFTNMPPANAKEIYARLASNESFPFQGQPWWLDAVCGPEGWGAAIAFDDQGMPNGALPFGKTGWNGLPVVTMPPLTSYLPVRINSGQAQKRERAYHLEGKILQQLISQLPASWMFAQQYQPALQNGLPFSFEGFKTLIRYTYVVEDMKDLARVFRGMESSARNHIRNARKLVEVNRDGRWENLYGMVEHSFRRQGKKMPFSKKLLERADSSLAERNMRTIYLAKDGLRIHAAACVVFDGERASFLLSGTHPEFRSSGALYLLVWEAIKDAARHSKTFDFEGSMHPPIERVFRSFGARRVPYLRVVRYRNRLFEAMAALLGKNR